MPAPASTAAASAANSADRCRASQPMHHPGCGRRPAGARAASRASPAVAARTTARFIRFGPAADRAAQARRAELQPPGEPVGQLGGGRWPRRPLRAAAPAARAARPGPAASGSSAIQARACSASSPERRTGLGSGDARSTRGRSLGQQGAHPGRGRLPGRHHLGVIRAPLAARPAARLVTSEIAEHLRAEVAGGDRLQRGGHADQVGAQGAQHPDLGRASRSAGRAAPRTRPRPGWGRPPGPAPAAAPSTGRSGR